MQCQLNASHLVIINKKMSAEFAYLVPFRCFKLFEEYGSSYIISIKLMVIKKKKGPVFK